MDGNAAELKFRCEEYSGSGVRDLADILDDELQNSGNLGILEEMAANGLISEVFAEKGAAGEVPPGSAIVREIRNFAGIEIRYGLWLADFEETAEHYAGDDPDAVIDAYTTGVAVCDLGPDGILWAYTEHPVPVESMTLAEWRERPEFAESGEPSCH